MASTAAPVAAPAPIAVDVTAAAPTPLSSAAPEAKAPEAPKPPAPPKFTIKGRELTEAEIEEALGVKARISQELEGLSKREADLKARDSDFSSKDRAKALAALRKAGWTNQELEELSADVLETHLKEAEMTPEQKELAALKAEKAEREAAEKSAKEKAEAEVKAKQIEEMTQKFVAAYQSQFVEALQSEGIPRTAGALNDIIQIVLDANENGWEVTPKEAAVIYRANTLEPQRAIFEAMDAAQLRAALGDKVVETLIKAHTENLRQVVNKAPDAPEKRTTKGKVPPRPSSAEGELDDIINNLSRKAYAPRA